MKDRRSAPSGLICDETDQRVLDRDTKRSAKFHAEKVPLTAREFKVIAPPVAGPATIPLPALDHERGGRSRA